MIPTRRSISKSRLAIKPPQEHSTQKMQSRGNGNVRGKSTSLGDWQRRKSEGHRSCEVPFLELNEKLERSRYQNPCDKSNKVSHMLAKSVENSCTDLNRGQVIIPLSMCYATTALESLLPFDAVIYCLTLSFIDTSIRVCFPDTDQEIWTYNRTMERVLFREPYRVCVYIALPKRFSDVKHMLIRHRTISALFYLLEPYRILAVSPYRTHQGINQLTRLEPQWIVVQMATRFSRLACCLTSVKAAIIAGLLSVRTFAHPIRIRTESSLWCSSPCPEGDKALFAIGTSEGLYTLEGLGSYWTLSKKPFASDVSNGKPIIHRRTDSSHALVTSVEWLSSTVIAAGLKDSTVFLHDLRSGGTATRLQHPHAVTKIRNLDPYRIVVAGINSLQMYDIRYAPNGLQRNPRPNHPRHTSTRPYLSFSDFSPEIIPDFDISPELGLLASASDERKVQLFSLRTGEQVSSPLTKYQYPNPISSLRFESGDGSLHGPLTPTLLVCSSATVDEWVW
ncbi:uncharacterized protein NFIA_022120 [Aspergillus fischeri NRRL 181]|uniref:WD domain protein n=1 Tax=Neosartorya fischeri (strain ATCC 1020 / DSM 3700 / CBS 544.65 / FGSC A1164 / JCM 1740 / NRRL 181 / WB 181) TaxID=331117 RepID=A1D508_NEOFI|nr:conserved hypothetical protein [Aspergillus fischeri NRRL 181]EAW23501.1 conserved hypothetical protein [Aspergillus fischeri NRRL 181]